MSVVLETCDVSQASLSSEEFRERMGSGKGAIAFVGHQDVVIDDLKATAVHDADVMVYVVDAAAGTAGRGAADLLGTLWQSFPKVAALISHKLTGAGAVVFSPEARQKLIAGSDVNHDPVFTFVGEILKSGGAIRAVLVPEGTKAGPAVDPAPLSPPRPLPPARVLSGLFESPETPIWAELNGSPDFAALKAGLLLWYDALDEGHEYCQSVEGKGKNRAADYWHAIMHRREPDYGNAKYWFRRVGYHPVFDSLVSRTARFVAASESGLQDLVSQLSPDNRWQPDRFIDACQSAEKSDSEFELLLRRIQADEMLLLLWQTCQDVFETEA